MSSIVYVVSNGCTLCGMCMSECSRGAISMTRERFPFSASGTLWSWAAAWAAR